MTESSSAPPASGVDAKILAEHRRIRELTRQLEETTDLRDLLARLAEFRSALIPHFVSEEEAGGLYETIRGMAPRQIGRLAQLEKEHGVLLSDIELLESRARQCLAGPVAEVLEAAKNLARQLCNHEAAEDAIMMDTLYTDLGQGD